MISRQCSITLRRWSPQARSPPRSQRPTVSTKSGKRSRKRHRAAARCCSRQKRDSAACCSRVIHYESARRCEQPGNKGNKVVTEGANRDIPLKWNIFVAKRQGLTRDLPPGKEEWMWVPTSATLIYGQRDAVLVDALLTVEQAHALVEWVAASGKNLTTIYGTHQ